LLRDINGEFLQRMSVSDDIDEWDEYMETGIED
jgi:hypothetical protein